MRSRGTTGRSVSPHADVARREPAEGMPAPPRIAVSRLEKRYARDGPPALTDVSFDVAAGELLAVVGPSGCGKTTLLRVLSGLTSPTDGVVLLDGAPVREPPREVALVFQDYSRSLFPWLTVIRNVMFPLGPLGLSRAERVARAEAVLRDLGLADVARKHPWELSGGMQQRVAIARALVSRPAILLLDEPFASVDALTRADLQDVLLRVHSGLEAQRITVIHVTHDIDESVYLADRVLVLSAAPGRVAASVEVSLSRPRLQSATRSSAQFLAARNEIDELIRTHQSLRTLEVPQA
jgi:ABC-type nitrate/sulfonate/bicarbonate transport system ATPase subunit